MKQNMPREYRSEEFCTTLIIDRDMPKTVEVSVYPDIGHGRFYSRMLRSDCAALLRACGYSRVKP